jgi:hypothetical protein
MKRMEEREVVKAIQGLIAQARAEHGLNLVAGTVEKIEEKLRPS